MMASTMPVITASNAQDVREVMRIGRGSIHSVAYSPDGTFFAAGSTIGVWLYDSQFQHEPILVGENNCGYKVAISPNGQLIASPGRDSHVWVWDSRTHQKVNVLPCEDAYQELAFHPSGELIANVDRGNRVSIRNIKTGELLVSLPLEENLTSLAFRHDGKLLAVGTGQGNTLLWDIENNTTQRLPRLVSHSDTVQVSFSPDGTLAFGCNGIVVLWDIEIGWEQKRLQLNGKLLYGLAFSPDSTMLATGNWAGTSSGPGPTELWNLKTGEYQVIGNAGCVSVSFRPDGKMLAFASGGWNSTVHLYDLVEQKEQYLPVHGSIAQGLSFSPDGTKLAYGASHGVLRVVDTYTGQEKLKLQKQEYDPRVATNVVAFHPDGKQLIFTGWQRLYIWNLDTGKVTDWEPPTNFVEHMTKTMALSADKETLLLAGPSVILGNWEARTFASLMLATNEGCAFDAAFSPDGKFIVACGFFREKDRFIRGVRLWDAITHQVIKSLETPEWEEKCVAIGPDGKKMAAGGGIGIGVRRTATARLWDIESEKVLFSFQTRTDYGAEFNFAAFSADGTVAIYSDTDGDIFLWDTTTCSQLAVLRGHTSPLWNMAVSPDGKLLATLGSDGTIRLWGVDRLVIDKEPLAVF